MPQWPDPDEMAALAEAAFRDGVCCAPAIVTATLAACGIDLPAARFASLEGLCGGVGGHDGSCGIVTGGAVALGELAATGLLTQRRVRPLAAEFATRFRELAGALECATILDRRPLFPPRGRYCRRLTAQGARLLGTLLCEERKRMR